MLTDTHCHLFYDQIKDELPAIIKRANKLGVNRFICVATNLSDAQECIALSKKYNNVYASVGIHPHDAEEAPIDFVKRIYDYFELGSLIAVGEIGLDYFRNISDPEIQKNVFRTQMEIAQELNKPIIFHNRDADADMISILSEFPNVNGVAHCFSSDLETARRFIELGYFISFSGNLTFKNSHLPDIAKKLPLDRLLVETDTPFLSPVPHRGKTNEPGRARFVAEKLAEIFNSDVENIASITTQNAISVFNL